MSNEPDNLKEKPGAYDFELPIAPGWFSEPPRGTMEDGIRLSLYALETVKNRPEIFLQRDRRMCSVEFTL